jgi:hypothetical protein
MAIFITAAVRISNPHFSDKFLVQNGLKPENVLSPFLFNFALEYAIRKVQEGQVELISNGTRHLLVHTDDVNLLGDNIDIIKKNTQKSATSENYKFNLIILLP